MKKILMMGIALQIVAVALAAPLRVIVLVNEDEYNWRGGNLSSTSTGIEQVFLGEGFTVLDMGQLDIVKNRDLITNVLDGDLKSAITLALSFDADTVILGKGSATPGITVNLGLFSAKSYNGIANIRAVLASTGQIISSVSGSATSTGLSDLEGERAAKKEAGADAAKKVASQLKSLSSGKGSIGLTKITIKGLSSFTDAITLVKELSGQKGIVSAERRNFSNGIIEIEVKASVSSDEVAAILENLILTKISVNSVNNNSIEAKIK